MKQLILKDNLEIIKNRYYFVKKYAKNKDVLEIGCGFGIGFEYLNEVSRDYLGVI